MVKPITVIADDVRVIRMVSNTRNVILANRFFGAKIARRSTLTFQDIFFPDMNRKYDGISALPYLFKIKE